MAKKSELNHSSFHVHCFRDGVYQRLDSNLKRSIDKDGFVFRTSPVPPKQSVQQNVRFTVARDAIAQGQ